MKTEYWLQRWNEGRTGWHRNQIMPLLTTHWPTLDVAPGTRVLVPFCGKSLDMVWLAEQGFSVLGVEVSPLGVEQFFSENHLKPEKREAVEGVHYIAGNIEIIQGDLFGVNAATLATCGAIYDRAAIIAQPPAERRRYAKEIYAQLPADCRGLMITLEYPQAQMDGPPFSVDEVELRRLLGSEWDIALAERRDILEHQPSFQEAGLTSLHTRVYRLRLRGD